jgi:uncharacterized protein (TIGR03067 family)
LRIVPKIDLDGFEHQIVERKIRLRNGILDELGVPEEDRRRLDPRPASTPAAIQEAIRMDRQGLQGVWSLVSGAVGGRSGSAEAKVRWMIAGDKLVMELNNRWEGKYTLDPARSPKRINLVATSPDGAPLEVIHGIYEIRGDELCICLAFGDEPRPESLRSSSGASQISLALKRHRR